MSRITCLIIFSGSSALSIRSLRLARTRVETLSSNAITTPFATLLAALADLFGFWRGRLCADCVPAIANADSDRQSDPRSQGEPYPHLMGSRPQSCSDAR